MHIDHIESELGRKILAGEYPSGGRLPSIRSLAQSLDASYVTIQKAVKALEGKGLIRTERGKGSFITELGVGRAIHALGAKELLYVFADPLVNAPEEYELELYHEFQLLARKKGYLDRMLLPAELNASLISEAPVAGAVVTDFTPLTSKLRKRGVPFVYCTSIPVSGSDPSVNPDFHMGAKLATLHLRELGHEDIRFVSIPESNTAHMLKTFATRYDGYADAMASSGLEAKPPLRWHRRHASSELRAALKSKRRPSALLAANDVMAVETMQMAFEMGLRVPEDLSVAGLEDMKCSRQSTPQLTTAGYDKKSLACEAVGLLMELIGSGKPSSMRKRVPMRLIVRASTGKRS